MNFAYTGKAQSVTLEPGKYVLECWGAQGGYNGGGSGYVYTSATAANYPSGNYVNSSYYLTNAQTIAGNQSFKSPDGTNETGHTGNGFCRITRKSGKIFVKQNGSWIKV